jgi:hypothetical protein
VGQGVGIGLRLLVGQVFDTLPRLGSLYCGESRIRLYGDVVFD